MSCVASQESRIKSRMHQCKGGEMSDQTVEDSVVGILYTLRCRLLDGSADFPCLPLHVLIYLDQISSVHKI